ncbi:MAG: hypothetical protein A3K03_03815 [Bdellovibrionales bacterium RIFOXYD1_FULL_44_7]|nr:MAG: hypothetical protein A3K03_03815 [Bdellovibrionales bacterium RIFOXYD1_FULL_44_7]
MKQGSITKKPSEIVEKICSTPDKDLERELVRFIERESNKNNPEKVSKIFASTLRHNKKSFKANQ